MRSVVGHSPPPFFKRGPAPLARLTFFAALSIVLLVADLRFHTLEWARLVLATVAWPMQRVAQMPVEGAEGAGQYFASLIQLQRENAALRSRSLATANQLLRQEHLEQENRRLRALLDMKERQPAEGRVAEVLYAARDPFSRRVVIDKGLQAGIAACHSTATNESSTDWPRILDLYDKLVRLNPSPIVALNRSVALGRIRGRVRQIAATHPTILTTGAASKEKVSRIRERGASVLILAEDERGWVDLEQVWKKFAKKDP